MDSCWCLDCSHGPGSSFASFRKDFLSCSCSVDELKLGRVWLIFLNFATCHFRPQWILLLACRSVVRTVHKLCNEIASIRAGANSQQHSWKHELEVKGVVSSPLLSLKAVLWTVDKGQALIFIMADGIVQCYLMVSSRRTFTLLSPQALASVWTRLLTALPWKQ